MKKTTRKNYYISILCLFFGIFYLCQLPNWNVKADMFREKNIEYLDPSLYLPSITEEIVQIKKNELAVQIRDFLKYKFKENYELVRIEDTYENNISSKILNEIPKDNDLVIQYLKKVKPDITGFLYARIRPGYQPEFVSSKITLHVITLQMIYESKLSADLLNADYAFLFSTEPIPSEIISLHEKTNILRLACKYATDSERSCSLILAQYDVATGTVLEWYPIKPSGF